MQRHSLKIHKRRQDQSRAPPPLAPVLSHGLCRHFHMGVWCDIGDIRCTIDVIFIGTFLCSIIWFFVLIGCCVACCAASKKKKAELV